MYKLSRPQVMVSTVVGSQKTHSNSETHILHTCVCVPDGEALETRPTGSATFLKEFPDMCLSEGQGHTGDGHSSLSPRVHSTPDRAGPLRESPSQQHTLPPGSTCIPGDAALQRKGSWGNTRAKAAPPGRQVEPSNHDGGMMRKRTLTEHFTLGHVLW